MAETRQDSRLPVSTAYPDRRIFIFDDLNPEDNAMLQALYSRSPASVVSHIDKVKQVGSGNFMSQFYVGYGHASIGDCGNTTLFIENVSMLAAKAIQDNPLYDGQEASTRYLDFTKQTPVDPYNHPASQAILDGWMDLYARTLPVVTEAIKARHAFDPAQHKSEKVWENACKARAFDVMRGLLPLGTTTLLSWSTNLRQARDRLRLLKWHPLPEVADLAHDVYRQLHEAYPNSYKDSDMATDVARNIPRDQYTCAFAEEDNYLNADDVLAREGWSDAEITALEGGDVLVDRRTLNVAGLNADAAAELRERPAHVPLPRRLARYGSYTLSFLLDFGSYRDIQRHRNGVCPIPLTDGRFGLFNWYDDQLQDLLGDGYDAFDAEVQRLCEAVDTLDAQGVETDPFQDQYLYPMGMAVLCQVTYSVPQMVYVAELRSQATVHASLRPLAQKMGEILRQDFPDIALTIDMSDDSWSEKRGNQTIEAKVA